MIIKVELGEKEVMEAIANYIGYKTNVTIDPASLNIEVKSKQNYKSEWEKAAIRVNCDVYSKATT